MDQLAFNAEVIAKFPNGLEIEGMHRDTWSLSRG